MAEAAWGGAPLLGLGRWGDPSLWSTPYSSAAPPRATEGSAAAVISELGKGVEAAAPYAQALP